MVHPRQIESPCMFGGMGGDAGNGGCIPPCGGNGGAVAAAMKRKFHRSSGGERVRGRV